MLTRVQIALDRDLSGYLQVDGDDLRRYILKFLRRRGFIFREGSPWRRQHRRWLESLLHEQKLAAEDRAVFGEYLALLDYKLSHRAELDEQIARIARSQLPRPQGPHHQGR